MEWWPVNLATSYIISLLTMTPYMASWSTLIYVMPVVHANAELLSIVHLSTNSNKISIKMQEFAVTKARLKKTLA